MNCLPWKCIFALLFRSIRYPVHYSSSKPHPKICCVSHGSRSLTKNQPIYISDFLHLPFPYNKLGLLIQLTLHFLQGWTPISTFIFVFDFRYHDQLLAACHVAMSDPLMKYLPSTLSSWKPRQPFHQPECANTCHMFAFCYLLPAPVSLFTRNFMK